jgi:hypothetical protein
MLPAWLKPRLIALLVLGGLQGAVGWAMVASGLVDRPSVSHYRLAGHLLLAVALYAYTVWLALELGSGPRGGDAKTRREAGGPDRLPVDRHDLRRADGGLRAGSAHSTFPTCRATGSRPACSICRLVDQSVRERHDRQFHPSLARTCWRSADRDGVASAAREPGRGGLALLQFALGAGPS